MIDLFTLDLFFSDHGDHDGDLSLEQINKIHDRFIEDFIDNKFQLRGNDILLEEGVVKDSRYSHLNKGFYHIIARSYGGHRERFIDSKRALRSHWIKPILLAYADGDPLIRYYKWKDNDEVCKEHFYLGAKNYIVVVKTVEGGLQIVTGFCVDEGEAQKHIRRYDEYKNGESDCN